MTRLALYVVSLVAAVALCASCTAPSQGIGAPQSSSVRPTATSDRPLTITLLPAPTPAPPCLTTLTPQPQPIDPRSLRVVFGSAGQLWLWKQETGKSTPYNLAGEITNPTLSPDGRLMAFTRRAGDGRIAVWEIWVVGTDGQGERRVAVADPAETLARYPNASGAGLRLGWLPATQTLWYYCVPDVGLQRPPYEAVYLVDAAGAEPCLAVPAGAWRWSLTFAPDGRRIAVLVGKEVRLIDAGDGRVLHSVPLPNIIADAGLRFSPDGRYIVAYAEGGLTVIDTASGRPRLVPLEYNIIASPNAPIPPPLAWIGRGPDAYVMVAHARDIVEAAQPDTTFAVWRLDLAQGAATQLHTFNGDGLRTQLSPDGRWLAYRRGAVIEQNVYEICLAEVESGRHIVYDRLELPVIWGWYADSTHWLYSGPNTPLQAGQLCGPPLPIQQPEGKDPYHVNYTYTIEGKEELLTYGGQGEGRSLIQLNAPDGRARIVASPILQPYYPGYVGHFLGD